MLCFVTYIVTIKQMNLEGENISVISSLAVKAVSGWNLRSISIVVKAIAIPTNKSVISQAQTDRIQQTKVTYFSSPKAC